MSITSTEIINNHPELFGEPPFDPMKSLICFGLEVGKGWLPILDDGFNRISKIVEQEKLTDFRIRQVKEKFGGLRIYCNYYTDAIDDIIDELEEQCEKTCDICGKPGTLRNDSWMVTRCDKCYKHSENNN